ncbi:OmpA family protein [Nocardiopsis sp. LOL_012]|uniref:OmpA family protein n=1 Tax=Nocardiopsis sp. LOL_012 TaxID=3345409 RepID=UPI003A85EB3A
MPRSAWSVAGEVVVSVLLLVGPPWLATRWEWPLGEDTTWAWFLQYLRSGSVPDEVVLAFFVVFLWAVWAAHLLVVAMDVLALARGLAPRVGLVRLVWVLVAGGTVAASTQTTALAAHADTPAEAPVAPEPAQSSTDTAPDRVEGRVDRVLPLAGFAFDSAELTPEMARSLEPTIGLIAEFARPGEPVVVAGHTDPVGDPFYNQGLSERRARAVADHMAKHVEAGVEIQVVGLGSAQPPAQPHASYGQYRRVEISYTLQRPAAPAAAPERSADSQPEASTSSSAASSGEDAGEAVSESAGTDIGAGEGAVLAVAGAGLVSGAAGAAAGYTAGRRRAPAGRRRPGPAAGAAFGAGAPSVGVAVDEAAPDREDLLHQDGEGASRGVIDEDGALLVSDIGRVDACGGVAFTGTHAAGALAAVVAGHAPAPVVATRTAAAALVAEGIPLGGVQVASGLAQVRVAVEAELLSLARQQDEHEGASGDVSPSAAPVLAVVEAGDLDADQGLSAALTGTPRAVLCVLGQSGGVAVTVDCSDTDRVRVRAHGGGEATGGALRLWSPLQEREEHDDAPDGQEPPAVLEYTPETEEETEPHQEGEQEQPATSEGAGEEHPEVDDSPETYPEPGHGITPDTDATDHGEEEQRAVLVGTGGQLGEAAEGCRSTPPLDTGEQGQVGRERSSTPLYPEAGAPDGPRLRVRLFVPEVELTCDGQPVYGLRSVARTLLSFLALRPEGADTDQLTQVCFADAGPAKATKDRRNAVQSLRAVLRPLLDSSKEQIIVRESNGYRLDTDLFEVDVWNFSRMVSIIRKKESDRNLECAEELVSLHTGVLLERREEEWVIRARERCVREAVAACVQLSDATRSAAEKVAYLEKALSFDEFNEPLYQRLMVVHRDSGHPEAANQVYRTLKEKLSCLGEKTTAESRRIFQTCVAAAGESAAVAP